MKITRVVAAVAALTVVGATPALAEDLVEPAAVAEGPVASYIVQFTPGSDRAAEVAKSRALGMKVTYVYDTVLNGMAVQANKGQLTALQKNPNVKLIEADGVATISETQASPTWGLDRIDQTSLPLTSSYTYPTSKGAGVRAYIIDTGINVDHAEFTGRTAPGYDAVTSGGTADDCNGHGTHVAGTVGGTTYGVAKGVTLVPVRVLGCDGSGSWTGVIAGIDWVARNAVKPAVANMSLGGIAVSSVDTAVANLVSSGVTTAVAAGNSNANACTSSPAREPSAVTVGATSSNDARASYSNYGTCLDIFAPGSSITSAWYTSTSATNTISGTSMATPHVAGAAALYLADHTTASPSAVASALTSAATTGKVTSAGTGSPNLLLYVSSGSTPPPPPSATVPSTPLSLKASNVTRSSARLSWAPPTTGPVASYEVRLSTASDWTPVGMSLSVTVSGLTRNTAHTYLVRASNAQGPGPATQVTFSTKR